MAVLVESGRWVSEWKPACKAVRYRRASLVAGSDVWSSICAYLNNASEVVTMLSISELARASSSGMLLTSTAWFGSCAPACLSPSSAARASMQAVAPYGLSDEGFTYAGLSYQQRRGPRD